MIYCEKPEFGQISRSISLNSGAILLKRSKNLTQIGFLSLRSVKPDRLLGSLGIKLLPEFHLERFALTLGRDQYGEIKGFHISD